MSTTITKTESDIQRDWGSSVPAMKTFYTREQVATHNKDGDMWVIIRDGVYDVTEWSTKHPGGKLPLLQVAGRDASLVFTGYHPDYVSKRYLKTYRIGTLSDPVSKLARDFDQLNERMKADGMFETDTFAYVAPVAIIVGSFALSYYFASTNSILGSLLSGIFMALFWQQTAFVGHDCGHNAVTHSLNRDWWIGKLVTIGFGVSGEWWKKSHNTHHITPNSIDWDPDIQHLPFLAIDPKCLDGFFSKYHGHDFTFDPLAATFISRQSLLFLPVMGCARFFMCVQSIIRCFQPDIKFVNAVAELVALGLFWTWFSCFCAYMFETHCLALLFVWSSHNFVGILHMQITLSHFSMDAYLGRSKEEANADVGAEWIRMQTQTTMDVDTYEWMDWFHGGLQYQCIHHLFPRVARHRLRHVRDTYVLPFLKDHGIVYHVNSWTNVLREVYKHLEGQSELVEARYNTKCWWSESILCAIVMLYCSPVFWNIGTLVL